ncbi:MAG: protein translocase subunit SecF [Propionibacteriaceae bacterium]|jgi:preprotein translocase subunit SecF|nr:protein translocase subunit SecF [Propionibacteriaceae bacterium]
MSETPFPERETLTEAEAPAETPAKKNPPFSLNGNQQPLLPKVGFVHRLYTSDFDVDFVAKRKLWFAISGVIVLLCIASVVFKGLVLGIEFKGGSVFQVPAAITDSTISDYTSVVNDSGLPEMDGTEITTTSASVRIQVRSLSNDEVEVLRQALADKAGVPLDEITYQLVGPSWGPQITQKGVQALVIFVVLVALLISVYFRNWKMATAALIALAHDVIVTIGVYSLIGFAVTPATITGVLTILGYSLYDTVVVFDKVRENTRDLSHRDYTFSDGADRAVNEVFVRSINTTIVGVLPVAALLLAGMIWLGGTGPLPDLGLAMMAGMIAGSWSSLFVATPLLCVLVEAEPAMKAHRLAVERRKARSRTKVIETTVAVTEEPVSVAVVPTLAEAAGRPQPKKLSRAERARTERKRT